MHADDTRCQMKLIHCFHSSRRSVPECWLDRRLLCLLFKGYQLANIIRGHIVDLCAEVAV